MCVYLLTPRCTPFLHSCVYLLNSFSLAYEPRAQHRCVDLFNSQGPWHTGPQAPHKSVYLLTPRGAWRMGPGPKSRYPFVGLPGSLAYRPPGPRRGAYRKFKPYPPPPPPPTGGEGACRNSNHIFLDWAPAPKGRIETHVISSLIGPRPPKGGVSKLKPYPP